MNPEVGRGSEKRTKKMVTGVAKVHQGEEASLGLAILGRVQEDHIEETSPSAVKINSDPKNSDLFNYA
jgi:hypothetical protein